MTKNKENLISTRWLQLEQSESPYANIGSHENQQHTKLIKYTNKQYQSETNPEVQISS